MAARITQQQFTLDSVNWTAIRAPFRCSLFTIYDLALTTAINTRSDDADVTTEGVIPVGVQGRIPANANVKSNPGEWPNFEKGDVIIYVKSNTGTITAVGGFL